MSSIRGLRRRHLRLAIHHAAARRLARYLISALNGIRVTAKATRDRALVADAVRVALGPVGGCGRARGAWPSRWPPWSDDAVITLASSTGDGEGTIGALIAVAVAVALLPDRSPRALQPHQPLGGDDGVVTKFGGLLKSWIPRFRTFPKMFWIPLSILAPGATSVIRKGPAAQPIGLMAAPLTAIVAFDGVQSLDVIPSQAERQRPAAQPL